MASAPSIVFTKSSDALMLRVSLTRIRRGSPLPEGGSWAPHACSGRDGKAGLLSVLHIPQDGDVAGPLEPGQTEEGRGVNPPSVPSRGMGTGTD